MMGSGSWNFSPFDFMTAKDSKFLHGHLATSTFILTIDFLTSTFLYTSKSCKILYLVFSLLIRHESLISFTS